jgi:hypothetical protein
VKKYKRISETNQLEREKRNKFTLLRIKIKVQTGEKKVNNIGVELLATAVVTSSFCQLFYNPTASQLYLEILTKDTLT